MTDDLHPRAESARLGGADRSYGAQAREASMRAAAAAAVYGLSMLALQWNRRIAGAAAGPAAAAGLPSTDHHTSGVEAHEASRGGPERPFVAFASQGNRDRVCLPAVSTIINSLSVNTPNTVVAVYSTSQYSSTVLIVHTYQYTSCVLSPTIMLLVVYG